jgi:hypothetical protein
METVPDRPSSDPRFGLGSGQDLTGSPKTAPVAAIAADPRNSPKGSLDGSLVWTKTKLAGMKRCLRIDTPDGYRHEIARTSLTANVYGYRRFTPGTESLVATMGVRDLSLSQVAAVALTHAMPDPTADIETWLASAAPAAA